MNEAVIGVDIGGSKIAAHISDGAAWSAHAATVPTPPGAKPLLNAVISLCESLLETAARESITIRAIGVGSAGQIDAERGIVLDANENIPGWAGVDIRSAIGDVLNLPVHVENDVRVMALAESVLGAGQGYRNLLCVTVGTGIGGALVIDGALWHGAHFSAGEIGYLSAGDGLTIEERYAGPPVERTYAATHGEALSLREIAAKAQHGDVACREAITTAAHQLGAHLAPVLAFIDPEALVVGGGVPEIGPLWWDSFVAAIRGFRLRSTRATPVLRAQLGNRAGMIGAAILAAQKANI